MPVTDVAAALHRSVLETRHAHPHPILRPVFLFTVHFFNKHFRPNKFPMDIVMLTGTMPLEEFKHEHRLEYERLAASGELDKYLVKDPGERATRLGRKVTGWLIVIGLTLAALMLTG